MGIGPGMQRLLVGTYCKDIWEGLPQRRSTNTCIACLATAGHGGGEGGGRRFRVGPRARSCKVLHAEMGEAVYVALRLLYHNKY